VTHRAGAALGGYARAMALDPRRWERLLLYETPTCPYCVRVRRAIAALGLEIPGRDVFADTTARAELLAARGRATVPVLRCFAADGSEVWMPESRDIIAFLQHLAR
jgi:glutaredoxin